MVTVIFWSLFVIYPVVYLSIPQDTFFPVNDLDTFSKTVALLNGMLIYTFLWFGYCQFYFVVDRSISVRIMIELLNAPEKKLTRKQITEVYDLDDMLSRRLQQIVNQKYVVVNSGYYRNTLKGRLEGLVFQFLKGFLQLGRGG
ncbi:MAG: hypothetical protein Q8O05_07150 [Chloroflexota bacterium]|nr:hypothetical protein [Chloroflexota bacterium]